MIVKLIGASLILIVCTVIGFEISSRYRQRPKQIRQFRTALQALEAEIMFGHIPLKEASIRLSKQLPSPINQFFDHFSQLLDISDIQVKTAWNNSLENITGFTDLKKSDIEILSQFGETLGKHDRYQQQKQIKLTMAHLEREEDEALDMQGKYEKMVKNLGFLIGLLIIILLI